MRIIVTRHKGCIALENETYIVKDEKGIVVGKYNDYDKAVDVFYKWILKYENKTRITPGNPNY